MGSYQDILERLEVFIKRYHTKLLVQGILIFLSGGLLIWLVALSLEYVLWLGSNGRLILFWCFLILEFLLLVQFVIRPLMALLGIKKGLTPEGASKLISSHFPDINDGLGNLLELAANRDKSELLLASIEQRSLKLAKFPFVTAVRFKQAYGYSKYLIVPIVVLLFYWISGELVSLMDSHKRVVKYDMAFERPAPFEFILLNDKLDVLDTETIEIMVSTKGEVVPEDMFIELAGDAVLMRREGDVFGHTLRVKKGQNVIRFKANGWSSKEYVVNGIPTPALADFQMRFKYPAYLGRVEEVVAGTGNAIVPEGTMVNWKVKGLNVDRVEMVMADSLVQMEKGGDEFVYGRRIYSNLDYEVSTSNASVKNYESLMYRLDVVKDAYPVIEVERIQDSLEYNVAYFSGLGSDDYGVREISMVCYPKDEEDNKKTITLIRPGTAVGKFYYTFPSGLELEGDKSYVVYFEVVDNDGLRGGKRVKSRLFNIDLYGDKALKEKELKGQRNILEEFGKSIEHYQDVRDDLDKLNRLDKENKESSFQQNSRIKEFVRKQEQQEQLMEKFSQRLKEGLDKEKDNELTKMLKERMERQELEAKKNQRLLEELEKLADKLEKEELKKQLEEFSKKQNSSARNLEQILELTKRYYVTEKMKQLSDELGKLSERQKLLSEMKLGDKLDDELQKGLNEKFNELSNEIDELRRDNNDLFKPMELDVSKKEQQAVKENQTRALEEINKHQGNEESSDEQQNQAANNKIRKPQKSAANKMKQMSEALNKGASGGGESSITEDAEMLRQILDNLVTFSFKQEGLLDVVATSEEDLDRFSKTVKDQKDLRRLFEHVDDSLFALSLRRAELSEFVNEQITEVYYNIDKSLESIAENRVYQGASYQQYVVNATNSLADFLANILDNMQQSMKPGSGQGQGQDFQLPDIIQGQEEIQQKMGQTGEGKEGKEGQDSKNGSDGDTGKGNGKDGQKMDSQGKEGKNSEGEQKGDGNGGQDDMGLSEVYEIYKQQQMIRQMLEQQLKDMINNADRSLAQKLVRQMEEFEGDLLENGITNRTVNKANHIQHQLLKLENAALKQGDKEERESREATDAFKNPITTRPELFDDYQNDIEILNRQALPLRQNYKTKVKVYFKND